jgi:RNase P/RNase MRP subunit POP5
MRPKRRYIVFEVVGTEMGKNDVVEALHTRFDGNINLEFNKGPLKLIFYDAESKFGLLRCGHKEVDVVKTIITHSGTGNRTTPSFNVLGVAGTIKAARRKFFARSKQRVK